MMTLICLTLFITILLPFDAAFSADKTIRCGTVNFPPFFGENLENGGFMTEISKEAFQRTGWNYTITFMNWNRAMKLCEKGRLDMVQGAYYDKERAKKFQFTESYTSAEIVIFKKKNAKISFQQLEDLKPYTFGILRGWSYPEVFQQATYLKKEMTDDPSANIQKLLKGRVDLIVGGKRVIRDIAQTNFPKQADQLVALDPPLKTHKLYNIITRKREDAARIAADFNQGLQMMKADGTYENIMRKHGL
jgi:polar amino acid transport system substrate-binding protein